MNNGEVFILAGIKAIGSQRSLTIEEIEKAYIEIVLATTWNKTKACEILGISKKALYNKIHRYGLKQQFIKVFGEMQ